MVINKSFYKELNDIGFLDEEDRDGYIISQKNKGIWAVQLDLLREFINVCQKYNLKYFADGGTLLGAVRHKGYIPWDDDIDIIMLRDDYNRLLEIGAKEFSYPYLFQYPSDDTSYCRNHIQIRNVTTTAILKNELNKFDFNQGIFIDVFVLDRCPRDNKILKKYMRKHLVQNTLRRTKYGMFNDNHKFMKIISKLIGWSIPQKWINPAKYEEFCGKYWNCKDTWLDCYPFSEGKYNKLFYFENEWYSDTIPMQFEMMTLDVPIGYRGVLTNLYGKDYMTPIHNDTYHGTTIFETEIPYEDYINNTK